MLRGDHIRCEENFYRVDHAPALGQPRPLPWVDHAPALANIFDDTNADAGSLCGS